jgi:V/A-type H+-transporting ATPase subunit B
MKDGIGEEDTREDHARVASQLYATYARAQEIRNLASIIGPEELSQSDRQYLAFADQFEERFVGQDEEEDRTIIDTLNIAWEILSMLGPEHLTRVRDEDISRYHRWKEHDEQSENAESGSTDD